MEECAAPFTVSYMKKDGTLVQKEYVRRYKRKARSKGISDEDIENVLRQVGGEKDLKTLVRESHIAYQTFLNRVVEYAAAKL